eukprot:gnl/TRDRNA2_/TRDRNA2_118036_c0_seq1.p3 gnl/TRDRNA2_/TRDRNA2_118036_c0~~gnl/TRDRNA2_/TRDRNA2_118036_c0_seq1.p3  ORF type:complete len:116 (+),score=13.26 gnl/TRDRNA2_/TRDRNA2_118036_c0_seq1:2-349(+)
MSLWMEWFNRGKAVALAEQGADVVEVDASKFHSIVKNHATSFYFCQQYAKQYVSKILEAISKRGLSCLTDLYGELEQTRDMAAASFVPPRRDNMVNIISSISSSSSDKMNKMMGS